MRSILPRHLRRGLTRSQSPGTPRLPPTLLFMRSLGLFPQWWISITTAAGPQGTLEIPDPSPLRRLLSFWSRLILLLPPLGLSRRDGPGRLLSTPMILLTL